MNGDQQSGPTASTDYLVPMTDTYGIPIGSLGDYMGLPVNLPNDGSSNTLRVSDLPRRAVALIWNEWFRDENLQEPYNIDKNTGRFYVGDQPVIGDIVNNLLSYKGSCPPVAKFHD